MSARLPSRQDDGADHRHEQQHRCHLERDEVVGVQQHPDRFVFPAGGTGGRDRGDARRWTPEYTRIADISASRARQHEPEPRLATAVTLRVRRASQVDQHHHEQVQHDNAAA
jgi:hypothetical protein